MVRRRTLIQGTGAALLPAVHLLHANAQGRPQRVAYFSGRTGPNEFEQSFERGLREQGWGSKVVVDYRFAAFDPEREKANVAAALQSKPDVFVVSDAMLAHESRSLGAFGPVVVVAFSDPIATGATTSLSRPDRNITGTSVFALELGPKRLEFLKQAVPEMRRAAALFNVRRRTRPAGVAATVKAGEALGVSVMELGVTLPEGLDEAVAQAARQGVQGIAIVSDTATINFRDRIGGVALANKLPTIFANRTYLRGGGLMSYGPDLEGVFYRAAGLVDRILKGARPADLPIEQPTNFQLVLNEKTARAIGVKFSQQLVAQATELIET